MTFIKSIIFPGCFTILLLGSACSSKIPPEIKQAVAGSPDVAQVRRQADAYVSQKVRWGGVIHETENKQNSSKLIIVAFPLSEDGQPLNSDQSPGRFIAIVDEFLEPHVYSQEREITVTGQLVQSETLKVGEFSYEYPVVKVEHYYLWPARSEPVYIDYPPYWWHDPYYPWPYPYYYPRHHRH